MNSSERREIDEGAIGRVTERHESLSHLFKFGLLEMARVGGVEAMREFKRGESVVELFTVNESISFSVEEREGFFKLMFADGDFEERGNGFKSREINIIFHFHFSSHVAELFRQELLML